MKRVLVTGIELMVDVEDDATTEDVRAVVWGVKTMLDTGNAPVVILGANGIQDSDIEEIEE